jgi:hypothetical protein
VKLLGPPLSIPKNSGRGLHIGSTARSFRNLGYGNISKTYTFSNELCGEAVIIPNRVICKAVSQ